MPGISESGTQYSPGVGLVYVFNLIVGTGALTMPKAFSEAGWVLSLVTVVVLAFMSYITVTFVTEAMAVANAIIKTDNPHRNRPSVNEDYNDDEIGERQTLLRGNVNALVVMLSFCANCCVGVFIQDLADETNPLLEVHESSPFEITERTELGQMANMFFNRVGLNLFYLCVVVYLYGDLSIYAATVPKSIRDVACTYTHQVPGTSNHSKSSSPHCSNKSLTDDDLCWTGSTLTRMTAYRIFVAGFFLLLGGFTFFNVQKTKYLQLLTTVSRWLAFGMMLVLAFIRLSKGKGQGHPAAADISGIPNLFGVCVYSFMCHHSLPSLVTPIRNKSKLFTMLAGDYVLILVFYALLSFTGIYAFANLNDIYTLNFYDVNSCDSSGSITDVKFIQYFLALFPVFTLSTNFPIISITLRNNLKTIFYNPDRPYPWVVDRVAFPLLSLIPPMAISIATNQIEFLVGITGSYAGAGIQYVIPAMLVYFARKESTQKFTERNIHSSPFSGKLWILFVLIWAIVCTVFVTVNHIITKK